MRAELKPHPTFHPFSDQRLLELSSVLLPRRRFVVTFLGRHLPMLRPYGQR